MHIRKQTIRLQAGNQKLAFSCRQEINDLAAEGLTRMFERIFSQTAPSGQVLHIDSLKVDLGPLSAHNFTVEFLRIAEEKLVTELNTLFEAREPSRHIEKHDVNEGVHVARDEHAAPLQFRTRKQQEYDALLFYVENGTFPWWYKKEQVQPPDILLANLDHPEQRRMLLHLKAKGSRSAGIDVEQWASRLVHLDISASRNYIIKLAEEHKGASFQQEIELILAQQETICVDFNISLKVFYIQLLRFMLVEVHEPNFARRFLSTLGRTFTMDQGSSFYARQVPLKPTLLDEQISKRQSGNSGPSGHNAFETAGFYINNAGLILLHPFLPTYFQTLQLTDQHNRFITINAQHKAAVLLYHLQGGADEYQDWNMVFNKVLCGLPSNTHVPPGVRLTQTEQEESLAVLSSVIQHWDALKGAGVPALQNTYILRTGKIAYKEDHWLLQVERNGFDVLIERLPWGIGTVKLPWLKELIYCEW